MTVHAWDRVYTVNDYYDGPVLGVADYQGQPHIYEKQFDIDEDEYTNRFLLSQIDPALFSWVMEDWGIWLRWNAAYRKGAVDVKTHPALPEDRQRHAELARLIGDRLRPDRERAFNKWARFETYSLDVRKVQWLDEPQNPDWSGG